MAMGTPATLSGIRKVKEAFDKTGDPVAMIAILRNGHRPPVSSRPGA